MPHMNAEAYGLDDYYAAAAESLSGLMRACYRAGRAEEAIRLLRVSSSLTEGGAESADMRRHRLGLLLQYARIAVPEYMLTNSGSELVFATIEDGRRLARELNDRQGLADALGLLGMACYAAALNNSINVDDPQGNYGEALDWQRQALALREELGDTRGVSESAFQIGAAYERLQQNERALEQYSRAAEVARQYGHLAEKAEPERHFAFHAVMNGELEKALYHAARALAFREASGFMPYMPLDHLLLSDIYVRRQELGRAWEHAGRAYEQASEMGYARLIGSALLSRGDIKLARGEAAGAEADYSRALELIRPLKLPAMEARAADRLTGLAGG